MEKIQTYLRAEETHANSSNPNQYICWYASRSTTTIKAARRELRRCSRGNAGDNQSRNSPDPAGGRDAYLLTFLPDAVHCPPVPPPLNLSRNQPSCSQDRSRNSPSPCRGAYRNGHKREVYLDAENQLLVGLKDKRGLRWPNIAKYFERWTARSLQVQYYKIQRNFCWSLRSKYICLCINS